MKDHLVPAAGLTLFASSLCAVTIDFENSSDLANNFNASATINSGYTHSATGGVDGSGGVLIDGSSDRPVFNYDSFAMDFTAVDAGTVSYTQSIDFKLDGGTSAYASDTRLVRLGFKQDSSGGFDGPDAVFTLLGRGNNAANNVRFEWKFSNEAADNAPTGGNLDLSNIGGVDYTNDWLRLELVAEDSATDDFLQLTGTLYSLGADGTSAPTILNSGLRNRASANLLDDTSVYGSFRIDTDGLADVLAFDNYTVVPEPSVCAMLAGMLAFVSIAVRRRR